ncbi:MAG: fumarylacetoacetate hydrolase family protein [Proteobacteria bacterium]|nr:fumarylacetoacetate hydrolase family protein [Pseudomonadota bacterium]NOG59762.1 fumarylacetoacetate hydrolase family protein [Pseudomonadota bacterium]
MKLVSYLYNNTCSVGAVTEKGICPAPEKYNGHNGMVRFLQDGEQAINGLNDLINNKPTFIPLDECQLLSPIAKPDKFFGVALNYSDHIEETGLEKPEYPTFFNKQNSCVIGTGEAIHLPKVSEKLDYEGELGVVIGKRCRNISREQAKSVIAGYTIVNDVTVRDWQMRSHTWTLGKSFDTHGPCGPWIVTPDEIGDPHNLNIKTWVNEDLRQNFSTKYLVFDCYYLVEYLSQVMTLEPGDIIATGTSSGVGVKMKPRGYMKAGDEVRIDIENIGTLVNPIIDEPDSTRFIQ